MEFESKWEKLWNTQTATTATENDKADERPVNGEGVSGLEASPAEEKLSVTLADNPVFKVFNPPAADQLSDTPSDTRVSKVSKVPKVKQLSDTPSDTRVSKVSKGWEGGPPLFYEMVTTEAQAVAAVAELLAADITGFDLETFGLRDIGRKKPTGDGLDATLGRIRLAQFSVGSRTWVVDCTLVDPSLFCQVLADGPTKIIHNGWFESKFIYRDLGIKIHPLVDTFLMAKLLEPSDLVDHGLGAVVERYLNRPMNKSPQTSNWAGDLDREQLDYAAEDSRVLLELRVNLAEELDHKQLTYINSLEHRIFPAIFDMSCRGVKVDPVKWSQVYVTQELVVEAALTKLNLHIAKYLSMEDIDLVLMDIQSREPGTLVNWANAPGQVKRILRRLSVHVDSINKKALKKVISNHQIMPDLVAYREACGALKTLKPETFLAHLGPDSRIHADWRQLGCDTGRMSCVNPNLQNIPKKGSWRECIVCESWNVLGILDYSQIELRVLSEVTGDLRMKDALQKGLDLHRWVASLLLGVPYADVTQAQRDWGKTMSFATVYGQGSKALAQAMSVALGRLVRTEEAEWYLDQYFQEFPQVKEWRDRQAASLAYTGKVVTDSYGVERAEQVGETVTPLGRRRTVRYDRQAWNTPIQSAAADSMKEAVAILWETKDMSGGAYLVSLIHDEFVIEIPNNPESIKQAKAWLLNAAVKGAEQVLKTVAVGITEEDIIISDHWFKKD
jgi:DNA polymerase-1